MTAAVPTSAGHGAPAGVRTSPDHETTAWPPGVPYIIGNEGCERFSYYGMRSILVLYMAEVLYKNHPSFAADPVRYAESHFHLFAAATYALPMIGAIMADRLLGKYRTILYLSLFYCAGHAALALFETSVYGVWAGLALIAIGAGGIKPCVSAHVGDQFGKSNWFRISTIYQAFYFVINFGSLFSFLIIPWVRHAYGPSLAFGIPGVFMGLATLAFWMGRKKFVHVPPAPGGKLGLLDTLSSVCLFLVVGHLFFTATLSVPAILGLSAVFLGLGLALFRWRQRLEQDDGFLAVVLHSLVSFFKGSDHSRPQAPGGQEPETDTIDAGRQALRDKLFQSRFFGPAIRRFGIGATEGPVAVLKVMSVFIFVSIFWALFDQGGSTWTVQAKNMYLPQIFGMQVHPEQIQSLNPVLVMLLIPFANVVIYPACRKLGFEPTPLRRMAAGMFIASTSFVAVAIVQHAMDAAPPNSVHVGWQFVPYVLITLAEVMVSITGLEFAYTQAPRRMKSTIMGFWLLTVTLGNILVSLIAGLSDLPQTTFFWVFAGLMAGAAVLFAGRAYFYRGNDFVQS